jgi:hypothetical protein
MQSIFMPDRSSSSSLQSFVGGGGSEAFHESPLTLDSSAEESNQKRNTNTIMIIDESSSQSERQFDYDNVENNTETELIALCGGWDQYQELLNEIELELLSEHHPNDEVDEKELEAGELYYGYDSNCEEYGEDDDEGGEDCIECPFCRGTMHASRSAARDGGLLYMTCSCQNVLPLFHPRNREIVFSVHELRSILAESFER